ncbi:MAG TPA: filamentous hemagglutinin N-terminal domain-containing protein, partial [Anaerolineales bacterium]|nr:filamentous hemagglutinin N-terminal domain-containing protein [Anaerolineales bacterium]
MRPKRHFRLRIGVQCLIAGGLLVAGVGVHPSVGIAQVATRITSSGLGTQVNQVGNVHNITGGTRPGGGLNLFHSLGFFSVGAGDTANFSNNTGLATRNILGRVTGGEVSNVFGRIQTEGFGAANLFLINPAGWIFGSTASLNVGGSFHVSTADYLRFPDVNGAQVRFLADASPLPANGLGVDPIAFGFLNPNPTRIAITGSRLQVPTGQTLSIVGGEAPFAGEVETGLKVTGPSTAATPTLLAPGGRIQLVSVASPGEVTLNPDVSSFSRLGRIDLSNGARIDVSGVNGPGGTVVIRGGQFFATQASRIIANTTGSANGAATAVDAQVTGEMSLAGGSTIDVRTSGAGASGETRITAASLEVREGSLIQSTTSNGGAGGDISVDVETATFRSGGTISTLSDRVVRPPPQVTTN